MLNTRRCLSPSSDPSGGGTPGRRRGSVTSGDAANIGTRVGGAPLGGPAGGGTLGVNTGDSADDAGDGSIDATDATSITGETDAPPRTDEFGNVRETGGGPIVSGALGPEDVEGLADTERGPDSTGPAADQRGDGTRGATGSAVGAVPPPGETGGSNLPGQRNENLRDGDERT